MKVAIIGAGENYFDIVEGLESQGHEVVSYLQTPLTIIASDDQFSREKYYEFSVGKFINLFLNGVVISPSVKYKENSGIIIYENTVIKARCTIGENVFINNRCIIGHDTVIGSHTILEMGVLIGGNTRIGESCHIGMGAKIANNITIKDNTVIEPGEFVRKEG